MSLEPPFDRRTVLKGLGAAGVAATGVPSTAAASTWDYQVVGDALDAGVKEAVVQGDWAYTANDESIATVDLSDPTTPLLGGTAVATGSDNADVKVAGDIAVLANDGADPGDADYDTNPGGISVFDVSDPTVPEQVSFYAAAGGVHNCYFDGTYAYLTVIDDFEYARMVIVDLSDPTDPVSLEGDTRGSGGAWMLRDEHRAMAEAGVNPLHDIYVQDDLAYLAYWDAGCVVVDVSDPTDPRAVAHFGAGPQAAEQPDDTADFYQRYLGGERTNAHYARPSPDGDYTYVGAETFPGPFEDTVVPGDHGGIRVFDTSDVSASSTPSDPYEEEIAYIPAPEHPTDATDPVTTSHNFDVTDEKLFASWYQGGIRAYDLSDPTNPTELAAQAPPGTAFWTAVDLPTSGQDFYTVGSDIGKGLIVLELDHETAADDDDWTITEDLDPRDLMGPTMTEPL